MSISSVQADYSLILADGDGAYYAIPVEAFERGRVPAERKAEIEEALRESEVRGYHPGAFVAGVVAGAALGGAAAVVGAAAATTALVVVGAALTSECFPVKPAPGVPNL
jgi:hypothetical protein